MSRLSPLQQTKVEAVRQKLIDGSRIEDHEANGLVDIIDRLAGADDPIPRAGDVLAEVYRVMPRDREFAVEEIRRAIPEDAATTKEIYNAIAYLKRRRHIKRTGYGTYKVPTPVAAKASVGDITREMEDLEDAVMDAEEREPLVLWETQPDGSKVRKVYGGTPEPAPMADEVAEEK